MNRNLLIVIMGFVALSSSLVLASELQLYCEGPVNMKGISEDSTDSLLVFIDKEATHIKIRWDGRVVIDAPMLVFVNRYGFIEKKDNKIVRSFHINRSNLEYVFWIDTYKGMWVSQGTCKKIDPQI